MKVGDYVRTRKGISKIKEFIGQQDEINVYIVDKNGTHQPTDTFIDYVYENEIIKTSPNIIDLIEVGDYVNGIYIEGNKGRYLETLEHDIENSSLGHIEYLKIYPNDIKSIVTREMFESKEYKVGELDER